MFGPSGGSPGGPGGPSATALYQGQPPLNLYYRSLHQSDYDALKAIHRDLFPIDYEEIFFKKAVTGDDRVFSWAAVHNEYGRDHLVGFVTARLVHMYECDPMDRQVMGFGSKCLDGECVVYVLTLGVVPSCRQCGIARSLLGLVQQHAASLRCRAIFLHVISYNDAAMRLYGTAGYQPMARLPNFYYLNTGRQPIPEQTWYDAFLYALFISHSGPEPSPAMQWAGGVLGAAVAPLRSVLGTFNGCMPTWFCRQTYSTFLPFAATGGGGGGGGGGFSQRSASKGSLSDTATSTWRQQQQQQQPAPSPSAPSQLQSQPLPLSNAAGVVCAGVTAEQFLSRGVQLQQQQQHAQSRRCNGGERSQQDWGPPSQATVGGGAGIRGAGPGMQSQQQQLYNMGSASYAMDSVVGGGGGGGSSAASSASVSGEAHALLGAGPPTPRPLGRHQLHTHYPHLQQQQQQPLLRPPSPPIPPSLSPSITSLQQRHPHSSGSGVSTPPPGGSGSGGANGHHDHHHYRLHHHHYQHQLQGSRGAQYGGVGGGVNGGSGEGVHGRTGEHSRGGIGVHRSGGPQGMAGGGLHTPSQQQKQQQQQRQQSGSVLTMLFRPPTAQQHPHSR